MSWNHICVLRRPPSAESYDEFMENLHFMRKDVTDDTDLGVIMTKIIYRHILDTMEIAIRL